MDVDFALPMYGLRFDGGTVIFDPVKAAALFSAKPKAMDFAKLAGGLPSIVELADNVAIRSYLVNAKQGDDAIVLFDPWSLYTYGLNHLAIDDAIRQLPLPHARLTRPRRETCRA